MDQLEVHSAVHLVKGTFRLERRGTRSLLEFVRVGPIAVSYGPAYVLKGYERVNHGTSGGLPKTDEEMPSRRGAPRRAATKLGGRWETQTKDSL